MLKTTVSDNIEDFNITDFSTRDLRVKLKSLMSKSTVSKELLEKTIIALKFSSTVHKVTYLCKLISQVLMSEQKDGFCTCFSEGRQGKDSNEGNNVKYAVCGLIACNRIAVISEESSIEFILDGLKEDERDGIARIYEGEFKLSVKKTDTKSVLMKMKQKTHSEVITKIMDNTYLAVLKLFDFSQTVVFKLDNKGREKFLKQQKLSDLLKGICKNEMGDNIKQPVSVGVHEYTLERTDLDVLYEVTVRHKKFIDSVFPNLEISWNNFAEKILEDYGWNKCFGAASKLGKALALPECNSLKLK
jgi:hypothetical protein